MYDMLWNVFLRKCCGVFILFSIFSCNHSPSPTNNSQQEKLNSQVETDANATVKLKHGENFFLPYNDYLHTSDTLKLKFKTPHPKNFSITTPDNRFFYVIYNFSDPDKPSFMDWFEFENKSELEIITNITKANPWDTRINENQLIFTTKGIYKLELSGNLENDTTNYEEWCEVYYEGATQ